MRCQNCNAQVDPKFSRNKMDWEPCVYCKSPISLPIPKSIIDTIDIDVNKNAAHNIIQNQRPSVIQEEPWHKSKIGIVFWVFFFFPVGIYFLFSSKDVSRKTKKIIAFGFLLLMLISLFTKK